MTSRATSVPTAVINGGPARAAHRRGLRSRDDVISVIAAGAKPFFVWGRGTEPLLTGRFVSSKRYGTENNT